MDTDKKIIIGGFVLSVIGMVFSKAVTYIWRILLARTGPESYGLVSLGTALMTLLLMLGTLGSVRATGREVSEARAKGDMIKVKEVLYAIFIISLPLTLLLSMLLFIFPSPVALLLFKNEKMVSIIRISALALPFFVIYRALSGYFGGFKRIREIIISQRFVNNAFKLLSILFFFYILGLKTATLGYASWIIGEIAALIFLVVFFIPIFDFQFVKPRRETYISILRYGMPLFISSIIGSLVSYMDIFFINFIVGTYDVGIYNAAYPTAMLMMAVPTALGTALVPIFVERYTRKKMKELKEIIRWVTKYIAILNTFIFSVFFLYSDEIMVFLFGKEYVGAGILLKILSIAFFIHSINHAGKHMIYSFETTIPVLYTYLFSLLANGVLNYFFIMWWGTIGAALATALALIFSSFFMVYLVYRRTKIIPYPFSLVVPILLSFLVMITTNRLLHIYYKYIPLTIGALSIIADGIIYVLILMAFKVINIKEIIHMTNKYMLRKVNEMRRRKR